MDELFQLRQNMDQEQLQRFAQSRMQMEIDDSEYMERDANMQMTANELQERYGKKQTASRRTAPVKLDMPQDEKESTRKRRERRTLKKQAKAMHRFQEMREQIAITRRINWNGEEFSSIRLQQDHFSPKYALEHYAEVRQELIKIKDQLDFYDKNLKEFGPDGANGRGIIFSLEDRIQLEKMRVMYDNAELALDSALGARGYLCLQDESGKYHFVEQREPNNIEINKNANLEARKNLRKIAKNMDEEVADRLMEEARQQIEPKYVQFREEMKESPAYAFVPSDNLTDYYQFDAIRKMQQWMTEHPDRYHANKKVLDEMYREVFDLMNVHGTFFGYSSALDGLHFDSTMVSTRKMRSILDGRRNVYMKKMELIQSRANYILEGMRYLLTGGELSERAKFTMNEFMKRPEDVIRERNAAEETAGVYAHKLDEKKEIFVNLLRESFGGDWEEVATPENMRYMKFMEKENEEHNSLIIRMLREKRGMELAILDGDEDVEDATAQFEETRKLIVNEYLNKMQAFDTKELENCTDEELLARMEELQEMDILREQMIDAAKITDSADPKRRTMMETHFRDDNSRMLFDLKCSIVQSLALRARSLAMIKAYEKDALTPSCLSEEAMAEVLYENDPKYARRNGITRQQLLTYAKRKLEWSEALKDAAYNRYYHSQVTIEQLLNWKKDEPKGHSDYHSMLDEAEQKAKSELKLKNSLNSDQIIGYAPKLKEEIAKISQELEKKDLDKVSSDKLKAKISELKEQYVSLQNLCALTRQNYTLSDGSREALIHEPIFRSYSSVEGLPSFHNMSDEEFGTMCMQLSAGALEQKTATEEELKHYRAENVRGLLTYKRHMAEHYKMLENRFHHRPPSLLYIEEHKQELLEFFGNGQVDDNLVTHSEDMIDMSNPEDALIYHLVKVYYALGSYIGSVTGSSMAGLMREPEMDYREVEKIKSGYMNVCKESIDYLDAHYI